MKFLCLALAMFCYNFLAKSEVSNDFCKPVFKKYSKSCVVSKTEDCVDFARCIDLSDPKLAMSLFKKSCEITGNTFACGSANLKKMDPKKAESFSNHLDNCLKDKGFACQIIFANLQEIDAKSAKLLLPKAQKSNNMATAFLEAVILEGSGNKKLSSVKLEALCSQKHLDSCQRLRKNYVETEFQKTQLNALTVLCDKFAANQACFELGQSISKSDKIRSVELLKKACVNKIKNACDLGKTNAFSEKDYLLFHDFLALACKSGQQTDCKYLNQHRDTMYTSCLKATNQSKSCQKILSNEPR